MKIRLDELVLNRKLCNNIKEAQALIMSGKVLINDMVEDKCGSKFKEDVNLRIKTKKTPYVSRGGLKLEKALDEFNIDVNGSVCMDIGASTGGFTHLLLLRGASRVYSVDVGSGQLDWRLRNDDRVVVMEKTNIRNVEPTDGLRDIDFICVDVSFISLKTIMKNIVDLLGDKGQAVFLIKPQFEARKEQVGEGGIVTDENVHNEVIDIVNSCANNYGLERVGITKSPITGAKGNVEFLGYYKKI